MEKNKTKEEGWRTANDSLKYLVKINFLKLTNVLFEVITSVPLGKITLILFENKEIFQG